MKTLNEYIYEVSDETRMDKEIKPGMCGYIFNEELQGQPVTITAILERTAVVHKADEVHNKFLVNLNLIRVPRKAICWVPRSHYERAKIFARISGKKSSDRGRANHSHG